jgi:malate dehydrogenase (oxaloacetate-decarboxylating)
VIRVALRGESILINPRWNKGTAFTMKERKQFGLVGRLPYQVNTLDDQCRRAYDQLLSRDTPLRKNSFLQSLKEQNSVLFYRLLLRHLKELMPIVYTPTEVRMHYFHFFLDSQSKAGQADAIANYSHLFRRSGGLYLTFDNQDSMEEDFLEQTKGHDIDLIVCSDAEAILGIGDQGVGVRSLYLSLKSL